MSLYKQMIIYELNNNKSFIKITITKNNVECDNEIIQKDIINKLNKINIKFFVFFVSLYDYSLLDKDIYWDTIKDLEREEMPIYRKKDSIEEFIEWYGLNFNNDRIDIYETRKFMKRDYIFDNHEKCLKTVIYEQTNPKFKNFKQLFFHAGNNEDIERYGLIYVRTLFNQFNNIELKNNLFKDKKIKIWDKFHISLESVKNTFHYLMNKMKKAIFIGIKNNKLVIFLPFTKFNYHNDFYEELYFDESDKKVLDEYKKTKNNKLLEKLEKTVKYYYYKNHLNTKEVEFDRTKWTANDYFFNDKNYEGDQNQAVFEDFFTELCANRKIPDCMFFINLRDHPVLHKDLRDSYTNIVDKELEDKYVHKEYCPIFSVGGCDNNVDIPLITQDDWRRIGKKIYPDDCKNGYIENIELIEWEDKISKAVFRGSATGYGTNDENIRIKASKISLEYPEILDAGVISFNRKFKKSLGESLKIQPLLV